MYASRTRRLSNGVMGVQHDMKPQVNGVNGMAERVLSSNGESSDFAVRYRGGYDRLSVRRANPHIFLLQATIEFCRLAGKRLVGALCELVDVGREVDGMTKRKGAGMLRRDGCLEFGRRWGIRVCTME